MFQPLARHCSAIQCDSGANLISPDASRFSLDCCVHSEAHSVNTFTCWTCVQTCDDGLFSYPLALVASVLFHPWLVVTIFAAQAVV